MLQINNREWPIDTNDRLFFANKRVSWKQRPPKTLKTPKTPKSPKLENEDPFLYSPSH